MRALLCGFLFLCLFCQADVIVLKNGKRMVFSGTYEVKGTAVTFKDSQGEAVRLPLSLVDLEKSAAATEAYRKDLEEKEAARNAAPPPPKKSVSMAEIAAEMEAKRPKDAPPPKPISIGQDNLKDFSETNKRIENDSMPETPVTGFSVEEIKQKRADIGQRKADLQKQLDELDKKIAQAKEARDSMETASAYDTGATGEMYKQMENSEKQLKELEAKRAELAAQMGGLESESRSAGIPTRQKSAASNKTGDDEGGATMQERESSSTKDVKSTSGSGAEDDE